MLASVFLFIFIGLGSKRFGARQNLLVAAVAVVLAVMQFSFSRFL